MMGTTSSGTLIVLFGMYVFYVRIAVMSGGVGARSVLASALVSGLSESPKPGAELNPPRVASEAQTPGPIRPQMLSG